LVREHTEALAPPRALWVPFMLGRPFGAPGDAAFQRRVLLAALCLLERETGPVIEDFTEDAPPDARPAPEGLACPVSFPAMQREGSLADNLAEEVAQLQAWHAVAAQHSGRSTLGVTGLTPMQIVTHLSGWLKGDVPSWTVIGTSKGETLKHACDELRAFYLEAKSVQPGEHSSHSLQQWFWNDTAAGRAVLELRNIAAASGDASAKAVAIQSLVPRVIEATLGKQG
jgi:hypothetical protein